MSIKKSLNDLLRMHAELIEARRVMEAREKEMADQVRKMGLSPNKTYRYIHEGQLVIVNTKAAVMCPQIVIPEVANTEYEIPASKGLWEGNDDAVSVSR